MRISRLFEVDNPSLAGISTPTVDNSLVAQQSHPTNVRDAAQQFEALLLSEIMR